MSNQGKAILWAAIIISAAIISASLGLSSAASYGITAGLCGAAVGSLRSDGSCGWNCLK